MNYHSGRSMIGRSVSHYRVVSKLGKGGIGVAVKFLPLQLAHPLHGHPEFEKLYPATE